jgi:putative tricarboxylic transport membrane protein
VRRGWQLACVILLGVFAGALLMSLEYSLSDSLGPGAGFFPFCLSLIGATLTIAVLVQSRRNPDLSDKDLGEMSDRAAFGQAAGVLVALVLAAAAFEPLGFRLTMLLFIPSLLIVLGARSPIPLLSCALTGSFGVFHVFYYWLKVPLPIGVLGI